MTEDEKVRRNTDGTFKKGHKSNGGRKPRQLERSYIDVFNEVVTIEDWREIIQAAVRMAKKGSIHHIDMIAKYTLGNPEQVLKLMGKTEIVVTIKHARDK